MLSKIAACFASDDRTVDSVIVGGFVALFFLCGLSAYDVIRHGHDFGYLNFGTGCAAVLGGMGGAKRLRDGAADGDGK